MEKDLRHKFEDQNLMGKPEKLAAALEIIAEYAPPFAYLVSLGFGIIYTVAVNGFPNLNHPPIYYGLLVRQPWRDRSFIPVPRLIKNRNLITAESIILIFVRVLYSHRRLVMVVPQVYLFYSYGPLPILTLWLCDNRKQRIVPVVAGLIGSLGVFILGGFPADRTATSSRFFHLNNFRFLSSFCHYFLARIDHSCKNNSI